MKKLIKRLLPERSLLFYHYLVAIFAAIRFGFPSRDMVVIGVTGTKGKTSAANFIWSVLQMSDYKTGIITTANIRIGHKEITNDMHMTMPGRFAIQKLLSEMAEEGCTHVVVETTSEGLKQFRHVGINYDYCIFTNLYPEHLSSHEGSMEKYKEQKGVLFKTLSRSRRKVVNNRRIAKVNIVNRDSDYAEYFGSFKADHKTDFSIEEKSDFQAKNIEDTELGVAFKVNGDKYEILIPGKFNVYNALPAIAVAKEEKIPKENVARGLKQLSIIPGRMERIDVGQNFFTFVDYAHERESMRQSLETASSIVRPSDRIIVLLGAEGGGRDIAKRSAMGEVAASIADCVVVSNVDPYDSDPEEILEDIARASEEHGKVRDKDLFVIEDRREGIRKALSLARPDDIVMITGKGSEQSIIIGNKKIPWDDREVTQEELLNMKK
ncbi:MAG: UDP-N-acetylmuramyl-tripeptide synthetase [Candidatus Campbellbacteria bacterium]|nr:UDP-N-acetylmuramyl-tripeptide synthetase [Candidatus Campbellbacteria bacterium]